ncbi:MAG: hypothetical protein ACI9HK_002934, partial [Pirellulaceae bacterium]
VGRLSFDWTGKANSKPLDFAALDFAALDFAALDFVELDFAGFAVQSSKAQSSKAQSSKAQSSKAQSSKVQSLARRSYWDCRSANSVAHLAFAKLRCHFEFDSRRCQPGALPHY